MAASLRISFLLPLLFGLSLSAASFLAVPAVAQESYRVAGVNEGDWLSVRAGPSASFAVVGRLPPDAGGIQIIDECQERWCPISRGRLSGWVNSRFLEIESEATADESEGADGVASVSNTTRAVLPDGTLELRFADGSARRRLPSGRVVNVRSDGTVIGSTYIETPDAELPPLPSQYSDWGTRINNDLLSILANILTPAEFTAYQQTEQGKAFYEIMTWRLRSIAFLTVPTS